jgi:hypothetical protein
MFIRGLSAGKDVGKEPPMSIGREYQSARNRDPLKSSHRDRSRLLGHRHKRLGIESLEERQLLAVSLFTDAGFTTPGLVGSYVNHSLQTYSAQDDWRSSQTITGTRVDANLDFTTATWGNRSAVGVTGGSNADWENFSVQWDGYLQVPQSGTRIATVSDDGSRMWIDLNVDGTFEPGELLDNGWDNVQGATTGQRSSALAAGSYPIRIQYYEVSGGNSFSLAEASYVPTQFVATPTNPKQLVRVLVLNYDPPVPTAQNELVHQVFGWTDPHRLASDLEGDMEWASGGAVDLQIVHWRDVPEFPAAMDNFRYTPEEYVSYWSTQTGAHNIPTDFYRLADEQGLAAMVNSHSIDEVWCFGPPGVDLFGESWMFGPNSFFINGPTYPEVGVDRAIAGHSFNYERGPDCTIHDLGHRMENVGSRAYNYNWNLANPTTPWDKFTANYLESPAGTYGIGSCHVPANADSHYDYANTRVVQSSANDWLNYPNMTGATTAVTNSTWAFGPNPDYGRDYLVWFFGLMPRAGGTTADGRQNNWYKYLYDFNSYEPTTGLPRNEDAFSGAANVQSAGAASYDFTVTYYDQTHINAATIGTGDVRVTGPGYTGVPTAVVASTERNTTAGTTLTVTYRITPPGGSWDLADNGSYTITIQGGQVRDTSGNYVPGGAIGSFRVNIEDPSLIDVNAIVGAGAAVITNTTLDIGTISNVFDGSTGTLARSANVNPAFVQVAFAIPQTVRGFNAYFAAATTRWQVETADTQADMDGKTGTYRLAVSWITTASDQFSYYTLPSPVTAKLFKLTAQRLVGDNYVHITEWQLLGDVTPESNPPVPSAAFATATVTGTTSYFMDVTYTDATSVDMTSVATGDLIVTGPNGFSAVPSFYDASDHSNGPSRTATYWFIPPGDYWDLADNGVYTVTLQPNRVRDIFGNSAPQAVVLGTFQVLVPAPVRRPTADLTEFNASQWTAWADGATASVADDTSRNTTGGASVRFDTTGGFDTYLRFPPQYAADWDLTAATTLHFNVFAQNPSPYGFQNNSPWIRLYDSSGSYADYRYYVSGNPSDVILNNARGQWQYCTVPLDASQTTSTGWRRYTTGTLHLNHITSIEFHADTWDAGFTLWYDNVGFNVPAVTTYTWTGGGTNDLWSNDANWAGHYAPSPGDNLAFPAGAARESSVNDYPAGTRFGSISVSGGDYIFQNGVRSSGGIQVSSGTVTTSSVVCDSLTIGTLPGTAARPADVESASPKAAAIAMPPVIDEVLRADSIDPPAIDALPIDYNSAPAASPEETSDQPVSTLSASASLPQTAPDDLQSRPGRSSPLATSIRLPVSELHPLKESGQLFIGPVYFERRSAAFDEPLRAMRDKSTAPAQVVACGSLFRSHDDWRLTGQSAVDSLQQDQLHKPVDEIRKAVDAILAGMAAEPDLGNARWHRSH